jgi:hypothetical protein
MASAKAGAARETLFTAEGLSMTTDFPTARFIFWGDAASSLITESLAAASLTSMLYAKTMNANVSKAPRHSSS